MPVIKNKTNNLEAVFADKNFEHILIYPLVRAKLFNAFIDSLKAVSQGKLKIDVLVSEKYGNRDTLITDNSVIFETKLDFLSRLAQIRKKNYDSFIVLLSWAYISPKYLIRILSLKLLMSLYGIRHQDIINTDNSFSNQGEIFRRLMGISMMYLGRTLKIIFLRFAYPVCEIIFDILIPLRSKVREGRKKIDKILLIENDLIGDVVWATPCLSALKKKFPAAGIHCLINSWAKDIIRYNPDVNAIIEYDVPWFGNLPGNKTLIRRMINRLNNIKKRISLFFQHYDLVVDLRGDPRTITLAYFTGAPLRVAYKDRTTNNYAAFMLTTGMAFPWEAVHKIHIVEHNLNVLKAIGIEPAEKELVIFTAGSGKDRIKQFLDAHNISAKDILIGIHPGTSRAQKQWKSEFFAQVADEIIRSLGAKIVITGSVMEKKLAEEVAGFMKNKPLIAAGELNLLEFIELVRRMKLLVSGETLAIGIASAVKTPLVCLMSGVPALFGPYNLKSEVIVKDLKCKDPIFEHCICGLVPYQCLMDIKPEEVFGAVKKIFS